MQGAFRRVIFTALAHAGREEFQIFYQRAAEGGPVNNWTWAQAATADDALGFVNGSGACHSPAEDFEIGALWAGDFQRFYIFRNQDA